MFGVDPVDDAELRRSFAAGEVRHRSGRPHDAGVREYPAVQRVAQRAREELGVEDALVRDHVHDVTPRLDRLERVEPLFDGAQRPHEPGVGGHIHSRVHAASSRVDRACRVARRGAWRKRDRSAESLRAELIGRGS